MVDFFFFQLVYSIPILSYTYQLIKTKITIMNLVLVISTVLSLLPSRSLLLRISVVFMFVINEKRSNKVCKIQEAKVKSINLIQNEMK